MLVRGRSYGFSNVKVLQKIETKSVINIQYSLSDLKVLNLWNSQNLWNINNPYNPHVPYTSSTLPAYLPLHYKYIFPFAHSSLPPSFETLQNTHNTLKYHRVVSLTSVASLYSLNMRFIATSTIMTAFLTCCMSNKVIRWTSTTCNCHKT